MDEDTSGENAKRSDGVLILKRCDVYSAILVQLKYNKRTFMILSVFVRLGSTISHVLCDCTCSSQEAYTQITDRKYVARCKKCLLDKANITVTDDSWHSVGLNLSTLPLRLVSTFHDGTTSKNVTFRLIPTLPNVPPNAKLPSDKTSKTRDSATERAEDSQWKV
jgi:hypothetical protein